ncbi:MAG: hypothetical protein LUI60_06065, partial [Clostridia bacterium]|nr:hypothetical protein [Clostridia bacterium]
MEDNKRFTTNLRTVLDKARQLSAMYNVTYIGSEQIVLAMLNTPSCTAGKVLSSCNVGEPEFRAYFARSIDPSSTIRGYTPRTKNMLIQAVDLAVSLGGNEMLAGTEHLLYAVMAEPNCLAVRIFDAMGVNITNLAAKLEVVVHEGNSAESVDNSYQPKNNFSDFFTMFTGSPRPQQKRESRKSESLGEIEKYGINLTQKAREGKIDPVIGRKKEIDKIIQILSRRTKNNPVLIG